MKITQLNETLSQLECETNGVKYAVLFSDGAPILARVASPSAVSTIYQSGFPVSLREAQHQYTADVTAFESLYAPPSHHSDVKRLHVIGDINKLFTANPRCLLGADDMREVFNQG